MRYPGNYRESQFVRFEVEADDNLPADGQLEEQAIPNTPEVPVVGENTWVDQSVVDALLSIFGYGPFSH